MTIISDAFDIICAGIAELRAMPDNATDADCQPIHDRILAARETIKDTPATTFGDAAAKLRMALDGISQDRDDETVIHRFEDADELPSGDFFTGTVFSTIRDLERRAANPLGPVASAWIDRWQALGGSFGTIHNKDGLEGRPTRMIPMHYVWTPPPIYKQNPELKPHEWITKQEDHTGAVKMLESFLTLVPGLRDTVMAMAEARGLVLGGREAMRAELRQRGMCGDIPDDLVDEMIQLRIFVGLYDQIKDDPARLDKFRLRLAEIGIDFERVAA